MINNNGTLQDNTQNILSLTNRGYTYGDALFETLKMVNGKILYWEDHYFRLMSSMRILRMEIPMTFTMEYLEQEILKTVDANQLLNDPVRIRMNVHRIEGGKYLPDSNAIEFNMIVQKLQSDVYQINEGSYCVDLFKDYFVAPGLLSNLKTNNKIVNVLGSIYAKENKLQNCLILNTNKSIIEGLNGNLFMVKGEVITTPPLTDGCLKGIMRKQVMEVIAELYDYEFRETAISPFELQKADELFLTNVIQGITPISSYRKKYYANAVAKTILEKLNTKTNLI